ncbi:MAG: hypothetical protein WA126_02400 [Thermodesulfovibrionales bacterium]
MKKIIKKKSFLLTQPLRSVRQYILGKLAVVGFLAIVAIIGFIFWQSLTWYLILLLIFVTVLILLDFETFIFLLTPYNKYKEEWEKYNKEKSSVS